jgi:hypothetical protein
MMDRDDEAPPAEPIRHWQQAIERRRRNSEAQEATRQWREAYALLKSEVDTFAQSRIRWLDPSYIPPQGGTLDVRLFGVVQGLKHIEQALLALVQLHGLTEEDLKNMRWFVGEIEAWQIEPPD